MKIVYCFVFVAFAATVQAEGILDNEFQDYWSNEDYYYDYPEIKEISRNSDEQPAAKPEESVEQLIGELLDYKEPPQEKVNQDGKYDDYQIEDNRSNTDDKDTFKENSDVVVNEEPMPDDAPENNFDFIAIEPAEKYDNNDDINVKNNKWNSFAEEGIDQLGQPEEKSLEEFDKLGQSEEKSSEEFDPLGQPEEIILEELGQLGQPQEKSFEEFDQLGQPEEKSSEDFIEEDIENLDELTVEKQLDDQQPELEPVVQSNLDEVIEETNKLLNENDDEFKADEFDNNENKDDDKLYSNNDDDDTPENVLNDLNDDLDKLLETLDKLSDNDSNLDDNDENAENDDEVQDYEEKYDRPYKEGNILSLRDDLDNFDDSNLPDIFAENEDAVKENNSDENKNSNEELADDDNKNLAKTLNPMDQVEPVPFENNEDESNEFNYLQEMEKLMSSWSNSDESENVDNLIDDLLRHSYGNDGLEDDQQPINKDAEIISTTEEALVIETTPESASTETINTEENPSTIMVDDLSSSEYNDLMAQFAFAHKEDLDVNSEDFVKNVAPIHITLSVDEPTVITSPNFPNNYPTNNIVDWIIEGPGTGIEMNITHFQVNGALGDYVLVKPGGVDASGTDGLIFSFRLNSERKYRFTNVNRMFVRFEAKPGMPFFNGFSFSVRMIWPLPDVGREEMPETEAILHPPRETLLLNLAGVSLPQFEEIRPVFKELIADMAQQYIEDNDIYPGKNTTLEVTQITRAALCSIHWPDYENCLEVTFGVPLNYDEVDEEPRLTAEDLEAMWRTYIVKDQFASRLKEMGVTEYAIPNDRTVLMVWLVIALGVVISLAMLAFALWRFSCFEDYTRMRAWTDSDSVQNEKKNLDLYPTPHQTLPPLYAENDYKWADDKFNDATRVDMGGFANKSYTRDNLFEFDSDEDIITPHDRTGVIRPRDIYDV